jgi:hypothetical protein
MTMKKLLKLFESEQVAEKASSKQQQKFMGMVHAVQKGKKVKGASPELKKVAKTMDKKDVKDFASTKHKGLPRKVAESVMLEAGSNLEHIVNRFKHETKNFLTGAELDDDLYNALYDYYVDNGEMPYGVAKAREGDPYQWVEQHFEDALSSMGYQRQFQETAMPVVDTQLSELARLAGLQTNEGILDTVKTKIDLPSLKECGDMGIDQPDSLNVSTNMSSDGTKSVNISAQGDRADELLQMLKMAGMRPHDDHSVTMSEPEVIMIGRDDNEMMDEENETEYANTPEEEYQTIDTIIRQGNDLHSKGGEAPKVNGGGNPMAEDVLDEELSALLDSILIRDDETPRIKTTMTKGGDREITSSTGRVRATFEPNKPTVYEPAEKVKSEGRVEKSGPHDLTGTWSADPPKKGQPDVPPPIPMDPVSPAAPKTPSSPGLPRPSIKK